MYWLGYLEMLEDEIKFGIHSGKIVLNLANSVFEPLNTLPLLLEASVKFSTERSHQGVRELEEKFFLYFLSKGFD